LKELWKALREKLPLGLLEKAKESLFGCKKVMVQRSTVKPHGRIVRQNLSYVTASEV